MLKAIILIEINDLQTIGIKGDNKVTMAEIQDDPMEIIMVVIIHQIIIDQVTDQMRVWQILVDTLQIEDSIAKPMENLRIL